MLKFFFWVFHFEHTALCFWLRVIPIIVACRTACPLNINSCDLDGSLLVNAESAFFCA